MLILDIGLGPDQFLCQLNKNHIDQSERSVITDEQQEVEELLPVGLTLLLILPGFQKVLVVQKNSATDKLQIFYSSVCEFFFFL